MYCVYIIILKQNKRILSAACQWIDSKGALSGLPVDCSNLFVNARRVLKIVNGRLNWLIAKGLIPFIHPFVFFFFSFLSDILPLKFCVITRDLYNATALKGTPVSPLTEKLDAEPFETKKNDISSCEKNGAVSLNGIPLRIVQFNLILLLHSAVQDPS